MTTEIVCQISAEEEDLVRKRKVLSLLHSRLVERELDLAELSAELSDFEGLYLRRVGMLSAKLDAWNSRITEAVAGAKDTGEAQAGAIWAFVQSAEFDDPGTAEPDNAEKVTRSPELKSLFRDVISRIHPDTI